MCVVDIRSCFFKKTLIREGFEDAITAIIKALPEKKAKERPLYSYWSNDGFAITDTGQ